MKVIISGSRTCTVMNQVVKAIEESGFDITRVLSGGCRGVDKMGEIWAQKMDVAYEVHKADWNEHGKSAGPIRNQKMVDNADALIAVWDGASRGTRDIIERARKKGLKVYVKRITD